ncbi:serine protease, partial [Rhodococcus enclensis]|nr:serine protease [Rhodococcus qingshengii]
MTTIGVVALLLGVLLIVVEAHAPTAGVLGALGALMIGAGVWMLFTSDGIGQLIAIPVTAGVAV